MKGTKKQPGYIPRSIPVLFSYMIHMRKLIQETTQVGRAGVAAVD